MKPSAERNRAEIVRERPHRPPSEHGRTAKPGADGFPFHESRERLFHAVRAHFGQEDRRRGVYAITGAGEFVPSSLENVRRGLARLLSQGVLRPDSIFLDAGSGDGRVVILVSLVFGLRAYGVEYDDLLWRRSVENIAVFRHLYRAGDTLPTVLCGDFCDEWTYARYGTTFRGFNVVFNYANDHHRLASKIAQDGAENVLFLYYGPCPFPESFPGLKPVMSLALGNDAPWAGPFLHAYRRTG